MSTQIDKNERLKSTDTYIYMLTLNVFLFTLDGLWYDWIGGNRRLGERLRGGFSQRQSERDPSLQRAVDPGQSEVQFESSIEEETSTILATSSCRSSSSSTVSSSITSSTGPSPTDQGEARRWQEELLHYIIRSQYQGEKF